MEESAKHLPELFLSGKTIKEGSIAIWNDFIGRPMDNIYDLKEVDFEEKENTLILWFNSEVVKIKNPSNLIIQPNMIAIGKAESIERENPHYLLKYTLDNGKIRTHCLKGNKTFSTDIKAFAFALL